MSILICRKMTVRLGMLDSLEHNLVEFPNPSNLLRHVPDCTVGIARALSHP